MKFFAVILVVALVACASAEESVRKLEPVNDKSVEPSVEAASAESQTRGKRGFVVGAYTAPLAAAAVEVAPAYTAPVAYTYGAALPYAYRPYASYYSYPAVYV